MDEARRLAKQWIEDETLDIYIEVFGNERRCTFAPRQALEPAQQEQPAPAAQEKPAPVASEKPAPPSKNRCQDCGQQTMDALGGERLCLWCGSSKQSALTASAE